MASAHDNHGAHAPAGNGHGSVKDYTIGFILSVILTVIPFALVMFPSVSHEATLWIVVGFAVIQIFVHLIYFLHMNGSSEQRWNIMAFAFTALIIVLVIGLALWIMASIHTLMMAH